MRLSVALWRVVFTALVGRAPRLRLSRNTKLAQAIRGETITSREKASGNSPSPISRLRNRHRSRLKKRRPIERGTITQPGTPLPTTRTFSISNRTRPISR